MKCPKCGYNSFDHLDSCKKCHKDLTEHRARFNIQSVLLSEMSADMTSAIAGDLVEIATASASTDMAFADFSGSDSENSADDFGFDFMGDSDDDENLAFDELFEEVASEDDVEDTLPAPAAEIKPEEAAQSPAEKPSVPVAEESPTDDFSFDESKLETVSPEPADPTTEGSAEFGFAAEDDPASDIFAETEEDFSLDALDLEDSEKK